MGSRSFDGVRFFAWSLDHDPIHVHGRYAGIELVIDLDTEAGKVFASKRENNPKPRNAKKSDVAYILRTAAKHFDDLVRLQEES